MVASSPAKSVMSDKTSSSHLGKIKHQVCGNLQVYNLLKNHNLLKHFANQNMSFQEFDQLITDHSTVLKCLKNYLPWIMNKNPVIKQIQNATNKNLIYSVIKIHKPSIFTNSITVYYRLVVNK